MSMFAAREARAARRAERQAALLAQYAADLNRKAEEERRVREDAVALAAAEDAGMTYLGAIVKGTRAWKVFQATRSDGAGQTWTATLRQPVEPAELESERRRRRRRHRESAHSR